MKRILMSLIGVLTLLALAAQVYAQMEPRKPEPELKKLAYFAGKWSLDGDIKPSPMGPGGKTTMSEKCEWMAGEFFLICHSEYKSPMGNGTGISFMGYDPSGKTYTYDEFSSMGESTHSPGSVNGDVWTFTNEEKMGGQSIKGRWTMKITSPSSYDFKFEMSPDGSNWSTVMDGKATKS